MPEYDDRVDAYIRKSAPFAQPILERIREVMHSSVPTVEETIKWSMPFFTYNGIILGNMAAFKQHCSFGIWKQNVAPLMKQGVEPRGGGMGSFGKLTSVKDLPSKAELKKLLLDSARKIDTGERNKNWERPASAAKKAAAKKPAEVPEALAEALKKSKVATTNFAAMSPSCQREYSEWIAEAKRDETRDKRLAQAMEWIIEGKNRHWKYQSK
jgi:hypothetical protein